MPPTAKEIAVYSSMVQFERTRPSDKRFEPQLSAVSTARGAGLAKVYTERVPQPPTFDKHGTWRSSGASSNRESRAHTPKVNRRYYLEDIELQPIERTHRKTTHLQESQCVFYDYLADRRADPNPRMPAGTVDQNRHPADGETAVQADPGTLLRWVHSVNPKSRMDAYPLFIIVRDYLRRILQKEIDLAIPALKALEDQMAAMKAKLMAQMRAQQDEAESHNLRLEKNLTTMRKRVRASKHTEAHSLLRQERTNQVAMKQLEAERLEAQRMNEHMTGFCNTLKTKSQEEAMAMLHGLEKLNGSAADIMRPGAAAEMAAAAGRGQEWLGAGSDPDAISNLICE